MEPKANNSLYLDTTPRMVSIYELLAKLRPLMDGYPWAEDALMDLWLMGAPDPSPNARPCPPGVCELHKRGLHDCIPKWGCAREKRLILPAQFAKWWQDVATRQGLDLTAKQALDGVQRKFARSAVVSEVVRQDHGGRNRRR